MNIHLSTETLLVDHVIKSVASDYDDIDGPSKTTYTLVHPNGDVTVLEVSKKTVYLSD